MGKRELLLILGFVIVGTVVYQLSAPASQADQNGFSWSGLVSELRREIRGNPAHAEVTSEATLPVEDGVTELRFETERAQLTVTGEKRPDIAYRFTVRSNGYDEAEARTHAERTKLDFSRSADSLVVSIDFPREAVQWVTLALQVPETLSVHVLPNHGRSEFVGLAGLELAEARGQTTIRAVPGRLNVTHRGGELTIEDVGPLRVNARGSRIKIARAAGETMLQLQGGELRATELGGPVELEATNTEVNLDGLTGTRGPLRVKTVAGRLEMTGLASDARIDVRDTELDVVFERAAPVAIFSDGEEDVEVTAPAGGFQLDALTARGRLTLPEILQHLGPPAGNGAPRRASGAVSGGGPTITLRADRGDIVIRSPGAPRDRIDSPRRDR